MHTYMYIYVSVSIYIYTSIYIYIHVSHIYIYIYIHIYVYTHAYIYVHICMHISMPTYISINIHLYKYIYIDKYTFIQICIHTSTRAFSPEIIDSLCLLSCLAIDRTNSVYDFFFSIPSVSLAPTFQVGTANAHKIQSIFLLSLVFFVSAFSSPLVDRANGNKILSLSPLFPISPCFLFFPSIVDREIVYKIQGLFSGQERGGLRLRFFVLFLFAARKGSFTALQGSCIHLSYEGHFFPYVI